MFTAVFHFAISRVINNIIKGNNMHRLNIVTKDQAKNATLAAHDFLKSYYNNLHNDSPYIKEIEKQLAQVKSYVEKRLLDKDLEKQFAVTLDIDDTAISHYPSFLVENFENSLAQIDQRIRKTDNPAIIPILDLYQWLNEHKIMVFFISYRISHKDNPEKDLYPSTLQNLQNAGYQITDISHIYLPTGQDTALKSDIFKTKVRKELHEKGYKIIANIGDQPSDLGDYAEVNILLPNKLYGPDSVLGWKPILNHMKNTESIQVSTSSVVQSDAEKLSKQGIFKPKENRDLATNALEVRFGKY